MTRNSLIRQTDGLSGGRSDLNAHKLVAFMSAAWPRSSESGSWLSRSLNFGLTGCQLWGCGGCKPDERFWAQSCRPLAIPKRPKWVESGHSGTAKPCSGSIPDRLLSGVSNAAPKRRPANAKPCTGISTQRLRVAFGVFEPLRAISADVCGGQKAAELRHFQAHSAQRLKTWNVGGGPSRNRTGVQGFAVLCVTTPPSGRGLAMSSTSPFGSSGPIHSSFDQRRLARCQAGDKSSLATKVY